MFSGVTSGAGVGQSSHFILIQPDVSHALNAIDGMIAVLDEGMGQADVKAGVQDGMNVYLGFVRRRYSQASASPGNPWADLKPSTKYNRLRGNFTRTKGITKLDRLRFAAGITLPILYDTGSLYSSFVPGEPGYSEFWWPDGVSFGSSIIYARYHQDGTKWMPARPILVLPDSEVLESMARGIAAGLQSAFSIAITLAA